MKKNIALRLASGLMLSCLLSTCVISGTFAKYVSTYDGSDSARVAKWTFGNMTELAVDMFDGKYTNTDGDITVQAGTNVVAPGTSKEVTIQVLPAAAEAPEVAYNFNIDVSTSAETSADLLAKLVWKLDGVKVGTNGTFAELQTAINDLDGDYEAGVLPDDTSFTVAWEWPAEVDNAGDTALGSAGTAKLEVVFSVTATQNV